MSHLLRHPIQLSNLWVWSLNSCSISPVLYQSPIDALRLECSLVEYSPRDERASCSCPRNACDENPSKTGVIDRHLMWDPALAPTRWDRDVTFSPIRYSYSKKHCLRHPHCVMFFRAILVSIVTNRKYMIRRSERIEPQLRDWKVMQLASSVQTDNCSCGVFAAMVSCTSVNY